MSCKLLKTSFSRKLSESKVLLELQNYKIAPECFMYFVAKDIFEKLKFGQKYSNWGGYNFLTIGQKTSKKSYEKSKKVLQLFSFKIFVLWEIKIQSLSIFAL